MWSLSCSGYSCTFSLRTSAPLTSSIYFGTREVTNQGRSQFFCTLVDLSADHHTKLSSMLEHSRKESTSRGLISCWWSAASMLSGHPAASLLKAAWRNTRDAKTGDVRYHTKLMPYFCTQTRTQEHRQSRTERQLFTFDDKLWSSCTEISPVRSGQEPPMLEPPTFTLLFICERPASFFKGKNWDW